jgi:hypothetical protein
MNPDPLPLTTQKASGLNPATASPHEKVELRVGFRHAPAMNIARRRDWNRFLLAVIAVGLAAGAARGADGQPRTAKVTAILGHAQFSKAGGPWVPLGPGMVLRAGDVVQTAGGAAVDLYLGEVTGTIRLTESSTLAVNKLASTAPESPDGFDVQLSLRTGELLGLSKPVPEGSRFEVKVASGLAQIAEGRFRVDAHGRVVVVEGKVFFAYVPASGDGAAHTLTAPPPTYFAPDYGVQPAPKELAREVVKQMRAKLPRR